jgi:hypothetical protein
MATTNIFPIVPENQTPKTQLLAISLWTVLPWSLASGKKKKRHKVNFFSPFCSSLLFFPPSFLPPPLFHEKKKQTLTERQKGPRRQLMFLTCRLQT